MTSSLPSLVAPWRIGVDVGGTFTDMVLRDAAGAVRIFKSPSVPADPSEGVLGVLRLAAQQLDLPLSALLRDCALFVHGSTVATNTILEKKGAKVGLLTTALAARATAAAICCCSGRYSKFLACARRPSGANIARTRSTNSWPENSPGAITGGTTFRANGGSAILERMQIFDSRSPIFD